MLVITRDTESGDFKVSGTEDEIRGAVSAIADAFGKEDELVVEWAEVIATASGHTVELTVPREGVAEVADVWAFGDNPDLVEMGEEMGEAIERANAEAIAKVEGRE